VDKRLFAATCDVRRRVLDDLAVALRGEDDIAFAYAHGSFVGDGPFHDVDVAVLLRTGQSSHTARALELSERLSAAARYPVDLRAINDAPLSFQFRALQGTLLAVRDEETLANFMERVGRRYLDIAPILRRATRDAFAR
jgi:predicted nucleotidyltransferase